MIANNISVYDQGLGETSFENESGSAVPSRALFPCEYSTKVVNGEPLPSRICRTANG